MDNILAWLAAGAVVGWVASRLMYSESQQGVVFNILVGMLGAAVGGWFISPILGLAAINLGVFNVGAFMASLLGALVLLAILKLVHCSMLVG